VTTRQPINRQPKDHTHLGRAAVQIFAANDRITRFLSNILTRKNTTRTIAAIFPHMQPSLICFPALAQPIHVGLDFYDLLIEALKIPCKRTRAALLSAGNP
jgi:hypothetical protein